MLSALQGAITNAWKTKCLSVKWHLNRPPITGEVSQPLMAVTEGCIMLPRNKNNIPIARMLRKNLTPEEKHIWFGFLREFPVRFRRQERIGNYIVDFYCDKARLVIELDGKWHSEAAALEYDAERDAYMKSLGLTVLRFDNVDVRFRFNDVCSTIIDTVESRLKN